MKHNFKIFNYKNRSNYFRFGLGSISSAIFFSLIVITASPLAFGERFDIREDETGGECHLIGIWDTKTKTCNMNRDLDIGDQLRVMSSGVTINGNNHKIIGDGTSSGVYIPEQNNVKVMNLQISNTDDGIFLNKSSNNTIENVTSILNTESSVYMIHGSHNNTIIDSKFGFNIEHGISIAESDFNYLSNNFITKTKDGIRLKISHNNTITNNNIWDNRVEAIDIHESSNNLVYGNNLFEHLAVPILDNCEQCNSFSFENRGNYVWNFEEWVCQDSDTNGICDDPFSFEGGIDHFPLAKPTIPLNDLKSKSIPEKFGTLEEYLAEDEFINSSRIAPQWVGILTEWLLYEEISEDDFLEAIDFLIEKKVIKITTNPISEQNEDTIPQDLKIKMAMWGLNLTDDEEFIDSINMLAEMGFINS